MQRNESKLTARQQKALEALLSEPTVQAAADAASVNKSTVFRWLSDPTFAAIYREARAQLLESTLAGLQSAGGAAVETLREVMGDKTAQPAARVSAARATLDALLRMREAFEVEQRLAELEARLNAQAAPGRKAG